jgi:hypothetical protein
MSFTGVEGCARPVGGGDPVDIPCSAHCQSSGCGVDRGPAQSRDGHAANDVSEQHCTTGPGLLFLFQIASGGILLRNRMVVANDLFGSLQTASGAYFEAFIISHLMAVFILARGVLKIDSNWDFAIGAPAGLVGDSWNVRLIPHYSLAVCLLLTHLACGFRTVLLAHGASPASAARFAKAMMVLGAIVGVTITAAMLGAHVGGN